MAEDEASLQHETSLNGHDDNDTAMSPTKAVDTDSSSGTENEAGWYEQSSYPANNMNYSTITRPTPTPRPLNRNTPRRLPQTPVLPSSTSQLYEHIDFLQGVISKQQTTITTLVSKLDSQQQTYVDIFKQQQDLMQSSQQQLLQQLNNQQNYFGQQLDKQQVQQQYVQQQRQKQQQQHLALHPDMPRQEHTQVPRPEHTQVPRTESTQVPHTESTPVSRPEPTPAQRPEQTQVGQREHTQPLHAEPAPAQRSERTQVSFQQKKQQQQRKSVTINVPSQEQRYQQNHQEQNQRQQQNHQQKHLHHSNKEKMKTTIISDSTLRLINYRDITSSTDVEQEHIELSKHNGATADKLHHMSKYYLDKDTPDNIIIVAGLNDILNDKRKGQVNCRNIANRVIDIGRTSKDSGVGRVCISEILKPKFRDCHQYVDEVNEYLKFHCQSEGFVYVSQSNIGTSDLGDNLHVSRDGNIKLKHNIFSQCYTYDNSY
jgi:hypothetical protein